MQNTRFIIEKLIKWFVYGMFLLTIFTVVTALFSNETGGEKPGLVRLIVSQ